LAFNCNAKVSQSEMLSDDEAFCSGDEAFNSDDQHPMKPYSDCCEQPISANSSRDLEFPLSARSAAATMSAAARNSVRKSPPPSPHVSCSGEAVLPIQKAKRCFGRAQARLVYGMCGLVVWSLFMVLWICYSVPDALNVDVLRSSPGIRMLSYDRNTKSRPIFMLFVVVALIVIIFLSVYGLVRPGSEADSKAKQRRSNLVELTKIRFGKDGIQKHVEHFDLESGLAKQAPLAKEATVGKGVPPPCCDADSDEGFLSCEEVSDDEVSTPPGTCSIVGILVEKKKLPEKIGFAECDSLVMDIQKRCSSVCELSKAQALRLCLGLNFDAVAIMEKWSEIHAWRKKHCMEEERARCSQLQSKLTTQAISFPYESDIYGRAFVARPCALVTRSGEPVSLWLAGTGMSSASTVPICQVEAWGRAIFEYADVWAATQSEATGRLLGQIQVFDMAGVGLRLMANSALQERLKHALGCGGSYVELVSHIYVINSSWVFSKIWNLVKPLISPRTASKVTVATDIPQELIDLLSVESAKRLPLILRDPRNTATSSVQRPPGKLHTAPNMVL
jgi:hypothetical protein